MKMHKEFIPNFDTWREVDVPDGHHLELKNNLGNWVWEITRNNPLDLNYPNIEYHLNSFWDKMDKKANVKPLNEGGDVSTRELYCEELSSIRGMLAMLYNFGSTYMTMDKMQLIAELEVRKMKVKKVLGIE